MAEYEAPALDDQPAEWGERPTSHGGGYVYPGRAVLILAGRTWEYRPEDCPRMEETGEWVLEGRVLVCPACGLDCT